MPPEFVDAVLFAEFDIDKGSVCRVQYPKEVGETGQLAELMLPEGAHNHFQDWTVFMLNRPSADAVTSAAAAPEEPSFPRKWPVHAYRYDSVDDAGWVLVEGRNGDAGSGHYASVVTDAGSKDMRATSPGAQVSIVISLGDGEELCLQYHDELQYTVLQPEFASMYSLEGEALGLHFRTAAHQEEFCTSLDAAATAAAPPSPMLWCLNHVSNRRDATVRRGAQVKAMAICSRFQFVHIWKPVLLLAVDRMYSLSTGLGQYSETPEEQCRCLFEALNEISASSLPLVSNVQREAHRLMLAQGLVQRELAHVGHVHWPPGSSSHIPLRVPFLLQAQELADASVTELLRRFRSGLISVFHALLNKKKILFLSHSQPAEIVCLSVLSSPLLVSPPLVGVLERCHPYATLNNLDFLDVEGFIAGTTNPIFESHPEWWDVMCNIDTGKVFISIASPNGRKVASEPPRLGELDEDLFEQVSTGMEARYSEHWLRACFQEHAQQLYCEQQRGSALLETRRNADCPSAGMIMQYFEQLRSGSSVSDKEMQHMFSGMLAFAADEDRLAHMLSMLPGSSPLGCLSPIAGALFHPNASVRGSAASLLRAIEQQKAARPCVTGLNQFLLMGLEQQHNRAYA